MITPMPTSKLDAKLARGVLGGLEGATATRGAMLVFELPNTSYRLHLIPVGSTAGMTVGKRLLGVIRAQARRIDVVETGGEYVEPVYGRPRRVQGRVAAIAGESVVVHAPMAIHVKPTDARQRASDFSVGQLVSMDVLDGATFEPAKG